MDSTQDKDHDETSALTIKDDVASDHKQLSEKQENETKGLDKTTESEQQAQLTEQPQQEQSLSKNQLKKKRRWERAMENKKRRKQQEKEIKIAKAIAEGRDIEKERKLCQQRTLDGKNKKKRQEQWNKKYTSIIKNSFEICIDCIYEQQMILKEINSLSLQIRYCYAENKRSKMPCQLTITNLNGQTLQNLMNVSGFHEWTTKAFSYTNKSLEIVYKDRLEDVVYLTSDADETIEELDNTKIYVIGGIVDRNRLKRAAITRAEKLGIQTAKLPLEKYLQKMKTTKVLTTNHVFSILLKYREYGNNWEKALLDVLPQRKDIHPVSSSPTTTTTTSANHDDEKRK